MAELSGLENSDWWSGDLEVPAELFAMEFVFLDPSSGAVDNNRYLACTLESTDAANGSLVWGLGSRVEGLEPVRVHASYSSNPNVITVSVLLCVGKGSSFTVGMQKEHDRYKVTEGSGWGDC